MAEKAREVSTRLHKWLTEEMGYQGPQRKAPPSITDISRLCRGNIIPVWQFLATRVASEKTVKKIRSNLLLQGKNREGEKERKERAELIAKEKQLQRSLQETDAALLRSHHEIEKLQSELVTLAQTKRRQRETYDEKRQRILLLQGAERQMRLDIAVFSEYNQRMLTVARFEQKRQKFEGPQSLAGDIQIAGGVQDAIAAICAKLSNDSADAQVNFPSEHAEEILRGLLLLCAAHSERLKEKQRQEALQGSAVSGATSRVSQLLHKIREEHSKLFLATEDNLNKADTLDRARATGPETTRPNPLLQQLFAKEQELTATLAGAEVVSRHVKQLTARRQETGNAKQKLTEKKEELRRWDEANAQKRQTVQALLQQNATLRSRFAGQEDEILAFIRGTVVPAIATLEKQTKDVAPLAQTNLRRFGDSKTSLLRTVMIADKQQSEVRLWVDSAHDRLRDPQGLFAKFCAAVGMHRQGNVANLLSTLRDLKLQEFALASETTLARTLLQSTAPSVQRLTATLLLQDIVAETQKQEEEINSQLLPSLAVHTESIKAALSECSDVAKLLDEWFNQPAQFALPNVLVDGQNVEQTLGRLRAALV